ncbi:hypothetical protein M501DRAFT_932391 [Patellaria atrata CBS 101060]|uniref:Uncharacterized protein n=1 Tax=Patellaria atrata CBS 101060 TaxID=1346257 RepID=A0A9P4VS10_9PEZI|nr:hypothetical protein M501DRAFT_932391 [Patellaria atrata CBS 101060]
MSLLSFVSLLLLLPTTLCSPFPQLSHPLLSRQNTTIPQAEAWSITAISLHFMGSNTGLGWPGQPWPENKKFNTSLEFTVATPTGDAVCTGNWKEGTGDGFEGECVDERGAENVEGGPNKRETGAWTWWLSETYQTGTHHITNNSPGNPDSYLTCLSGPPLDGIRCAMNGVMSARGDVVLEVERLRKPNV